MKALIALVVTAGVLFGGVEVLRHASQYHNTGYHGRSTTVTFSVRTKDNHSDAFAAATLWDHCVNVLAWKSSDGPSATVDGFRASLHPGLGHDGERRLTGCLQDLSVDQVRGHVVSVHTA